MLALEFLSQQALDKAKHVSLCRGQELKRLISWVDKADSKYTDVSAPQYRKTPYCTTIVTRHPRKTIWSHTLFLLAVQATLQ